MGELSEDVIAFLSEGTRTAVLGWVAADGRPLAAPVWFVVDDGETGFLIDPAAPDDAWAEPGTVEVTGTVATPTGGEVAATATVVVVSLLDRRGPPLRTDRFLRRLHVPERRRA